MSYEQLNKLFYKDTERYRQLYEDRFNSDYAVKLGVNIGTNEAFFMREPTLYEKVDRIRKNDKTIASLRAELPESALKQYLNKCLFDEVMLTNNIEGIRSTRKEIDKVLKNPKKKQRFQGLVNRYNMMEEEMLFLESCDDVRQVYDELVGDEVTDKPDGKIFRKESVSVHTVTDKEIHTGVSPETKICEYMTKAIEILDNKSINILFRIAVFHYLFGYIHPFYDGNGRTSRFISSYILANELESIVGYRLSYAIKENINKYYKSFEICNDAKSKGDLTPFICMFLDIVETSTLNLIEALETRLSKLKAYAERIENLFSDNQLCYTLLQATLFSDDGVSRYDIAKDCGISDSTVSKRLKELSSVSPDLIIKKTLNRVNYYSLNLDYLD